METCLAVAFLLVTYLCGAIPTGYWVGKAKGIDITKEGSGSTGATNVLRCVGKAEALFVLIFDILKGYGPVAFAIATEPSHWSKIPHLPPHTISVVAALIAIIGHSKSVFLGFKGGKSAATTLGTLLALNLAVGLLTFTTWLVVLFLFKIVSVASIVASVACPILFAIFHSPYMVQGFSIIACIYVIARHQTNIKRLLAGTEPKIGKKSEAVQESAQKEHPDSKQDKIEESGSQASERETSSQ